MIIEKIENYIKQYLSFALPEVVLPIALWTLGTHVFQTFDSFAYMVITSKTKRSGKTLLSEIISFAASNPMNFSAMTGSTLFRVINPDPKTYYPKDRPFIPPTVVFDEAESLSSESQSTIRSVLNVGYRKGQTVPRMVGQEVVQFKVFCPKVFILIGDVYDTLRDRSIVIEMQRADAPKRYLYNEAQLEGNTLRAEIIEHWAKRPAFTDEVAETYRKIRADFLSGRDEEIWLPLFALCKAACPSRYRQLQRVAVDLCALKTQDKSTYKNLSLFETQNEQQEYAEKAAVDLLAVINGEKSISSAVAVEKMLELDLSPWRTFRGKPMDQYCLTQLMSSVGIPSVNIRFGKQVLKGYRKLDVKTFVKQLR